MAFAAAAMMPMVGVCGSCKSTVSGLTRSLQSLSLSRPARPNQTRLSRQPLIIEASRKCDLTGKKANNGYNVTFSHIRNKRLQGANLQKRRLFWPEMQRWVTLKVSTKALKSIEKKGGLQAMAKEAGIDLMKLPYKDGRPGRTEWLKENAPHQPAVSQKGKMKNSERLAASKKKPKVAYYLEGSCRVAYRHADQKVEDN